MVFCSIASGSSGNAIFVEGKDTRLLVDAGISKKRIEDGLSEIGCSASLLDAILITHEHIDHIKGLGVMSRKYNLPIYATRGTIDMIKATASVGEIKDELFVEIEANSSFVIKDLFIDAFSLYHDAVDPVTYKISDCKNSVGILTDCGKFDDNIVSSLKGVNVLLLEANHDEHMLRAGKYPYTLKQRILSDRGHLSNETGGRFLRELLDENLKYVMLGHISKDNNLEDLAYETVRLEVDMGDNSFDSADFKLMVANRDNISEIIKI